MTIEEIIHLIKQGETRILELKKTTGELQEAMHSACAMLNSDGGHLIFGITPRSLNNEQQVGSKLAVSWQQVGSKKSTNYTTNYTTNTKIHIPMLSISNLPRIWF